ncbi:MAG: MATE family efflux transporter [Lachnospiraceae bacterium]|jgi:putative MATE family efflux protein
MTKNLTIGEPRKILPRFALPLLISAMFQQLYNVFDSLIAGRGIGPDALAAVGASYPITMLFIAFAIGGSMGTSIVVSQLFGAQKNDQVHTSIQTALISVVILSLLLTAVGLALSRTALELLRTPSNIMGDSLTYFNIYILGLIFLFIYNVVTGIFQALGNSQTPLFLLIGSSVGNIILDIIFVVSFQWGVAGVAWATFIAQGASCILAFFLLMRHLKHLPGKEKSRHFSMIMLKKICTIAFPSICQQSFVSVGNLLVQAVINSYGSSVIAGYNVGLKINMFVVTCSSSFSNGLGSYTAQNLGAGKPERIDEGYRVILRSLYSFMIPITILIFASSRFIITLFIGNSDPVAVQTGIEFLKICSPFYLIIIIKFVADNVLKGAGAMVPFMITTFSDLILRVAASYLFSYLFGSTGIWAAWPVGWVIGTIIAAVFYCKKSWLKFMHVS